MSQRHKDYLKNKESKKVKKLCDFVKQCSISTPPRTQLSPSLDPSVLEKWPKCCKKVPPIYLHKPVDFSFHVKPLLDSKIKFYRPYLGRTYTKIKFPTQSDHKETAKYFDSLNLPYHTYGVHTKRKMKVVVSGFPTDITLGDVKKELENVSIPVVRIHRMRTKPDRDRPVLVMVVVPQNEEGHRLLQAQRIAGHDVKLEPPQDKPKQCHRCQRWGHAQRYCHGQVKCVKCAGDHYSKKCPFDKSIPPKCANCDGVHTANFTKCPSCPKSKEYKQTQKLKKRWARFFDSSIPNVVTMKNINKLYRNVAYSCTAPIIVGDVN